MPMYLNNTSINTLCLMSNDCLFVSAAVIAVENSVSAMGHKDTKRTQKSRRVWQLRDVTNEPDDTLPPLNYRGETGEGVSRIVEFLGQHYLFSDRPGGPRTWGGWTHWRTADLLYKRNAPTGTENCWFQVHPGLPVYFVDYRKPLLALGWFTHPESNVPHVCCCVPEKCMDVLLTTAQKSHLGNVLRFISIWNIDLLRTYTYARAWNQKRPADLAELKDTPSLLSQLEEKITEKPDTLPPGIKSGLKGLELSYKPFLSSTSSAAVHEEALDEEDGTVAKRPRTGDKAKESKSQPSKKQKQAGDKVSNIVIANC
jgi:hypothetical protein